LIGGATGCHSHVVRPEPVTTTSIIGMSKQGVPPDAIIEKIEYSGTVYHMDSKDVVDLGKAGVDSRVIDHMMHTAEREARRRARYYHRRAVWTYDPWYPHWHRPPYIGFGFGYHGW